jgi:AcrR family transcriptional regulator
MLDRASGRPHDIRRNQNRFFVLNEIICMPATKDEIALTFMALAVRFGFRRTAVEDVARQLRISKKTIYEYFSSKDELLEYALELGALRQRQRVESLLSESTALGRALQVTRIALSDARAGFAQNPGAELVEPPELQTRVNDRVYGPMVRNLLEQGVAAGEFEVADVDMTSRFVQAIGMEAVRQIHDDPASDPEEATVEAIRRLITGESAAPAPVAVPAKKSKNKAKKKR